MLHSAVFVGTNDLFSGLSLLKEIRSLSIKDYCKLRVKYSNFSGSHSVQLAEGPAYRGPLNSTLLQMQRKLQSACSNQGQPRHVGIGQVEATQAPSGFAEVVVEDPS